MPRSPSRARALAGGVVRVATLVWLTFHFALTALFVLPPNPLTGPIRPSLEQAMGSLFYQNWSLFAPNPIQSDEILLALPLTAAQHARHARVGLPAGGWYDLSTPLWHAAQRNRFAAYDRLARPHSTAVRGLQGTEVVDPLNWRLCQRGDSTTCRGLQERVRKSRDEARRLTARIASAFVNELPAGPQPFTHVAVRVRSRPALPWSERHTGRRPQVDYDVGIFPVDARVAPAGVYAVAAREGR